jgi:hypothetical protein
MRTEFGGEHSTAAQAACIESLLIATWPGTAWKSRQAHRIGAVPGHAARCEGLKGRSGGASRLGQAWSRLSAFSDRGARVRATALLFEDLPAESRGICGI